MSKSVKHYMLKYVDLGKVDKRVPPSDITKFYNRSQRKTSTKADILLESGAAAGTRGLESTYAEQRVKSLQSIRERETHLLKADSERNLQLLAKTAKKESGLDLYSTLVEEP
mmetsp:Transcript_5166/g.12534  ORF Transcript_5166/g.12534 Transcript_5166/m.12534 type:complete len:112 (+) Transcript_5166:1646-1981(+)